MAELSESESLRNKHGDIYRAMMTAIDKAATQSGAFADEESRAAYVSETAAMFADQVLAEANFRKVAIDEVLKASDIVFEDGGIKFKTGTRTFDASGNVLMQNRYDEFMMGNRFANLPDGFMKDVESIVRYGVLPTKKERVALREKFGVSNEDITAVSEYISDLRRRRFIRKNMPRQIPPKEKLARKRKAEQQTMQNEENRRKAVSSLSEDVFGSMSGAEKEQYVRDYSEAGLRDRRDIVAHSNLMFFKNKILPELLKSGDVKKVKESDLSESVYLDGLRVSDHSLPGKYNGDDGVILSGNMSAKEIKDAVLQEIDERKRPLYQTNANANLSSEIDELLDVVNEGKNRSETRKVGVVSIQLNRLAKENANLDLTGYVHNIDTSSIKHIQNNHGDPRTEAARGQIAVTTEDLKKIPLFIYDWDYIAFGGKNKRNQDVIIYGKNMPDGSSVYVEEVRTGKKTLTTNTIRKYKTGVNSNSFTSRIGEDVQNDTSHIKIISKNELNGNMLSQGMASGGVKGSYSPYNRLLKITEKADYSTLPHEFAHFWLSEMENWVNSGLASEDYLKRYNIAMDWLKSEVGVCDDDGGKKGEYFLKTEAFISCPFRFYTLYGLYATNSDIPVCYL